MKRSIRLTLIILSIASIFIQFKTANKKISQAIDKVNYETDIKTIIKENCLECHSGKRPKARLDLSTYDNIKYAINNKGLIGRINNEKKPMPRKGLMSEEKRALISKWMKEGFQKS